MKTIKGIPWNKVILVLTLALLAGVSPVRAQQRGQQDSKEVSVSKVVRLNRAPVSKEILKIKLPRPKEFTLSNGLTVLVVEDHRFPTISLRLQINGAGGLYQPEDNLALAGAAIALIDTGTTTRTSKQIAEEQDRLGITLRGGAGMSSISATLNASGLSDNFDEWFELVSDVLLNPTFTDEEIQKHVRRQKAQLQQINALPIFQSIKWFNKAVYGDHKLHRFFPSESDLDALTTEALAQWHRERFVPQNSIMGIVGDVDTKALITKLENWAAKWKKSGLKVELPAGPKRHGQKRVFLIHRPGSVQTNLRMGNLAMERKNPDYYATRVLNRILGQGPASRLFLNIREEKGYAYGVSAGIGAGRFLSPWQASSDVRTEVTEDTMKEFFYEFNRIRDEEVPEAELEEAKRALVARFALQLENADSTLGRGITLLNYGFPPDYWDVYPSKIMAVTAEDVKRVARKYLDLESMQLVAVGDVAQIRPVLEKYGLVEVFDTEGKPVDMEALAAEKAAAEKAAAGPAANVAGKWELSMTGPGGRTQTINLMLEQDGANLTGTVAGPRGNEQPVAGTVKGETIRFTMKQQTPRGEVEIVYSGTVDGETMKGTMQMMSFSRDWTAKKVE